MASNLFDTYQQYCLKLIYNSLQRMVGQSQNLIVDEALFRQHIINETWNYLPLPLRQLGRDQLRWDEFFLALRMEVFVTLEGKLALRPDALQRLEILARRLFGGGSGTGLGKPPAQAPARPTNLTPPALPRPTLTPPDLPAQAPPARAERTAPAPAPLPVRKTVAPQPATGDEIALGIDLGTTYSVVSYLDPYGRPVSIPNTVGEILTPSVVLFDEGGTVVGKEAVLASAMEPEKVADCVKRDMGTKAYRKKINGQDVPPEVISSIILRCLKADAQRKLGPVTKAVITVPAYFDESRRRATLDAGRLAGLEVLDIINEPTAAAIAYDFQLGCLNSSGPLPGSAPLRVLVYDLGSGTFDLTIVEIQGNTFKAIATDGDVQLGGKDWDEQLVHLAAERFQSQYRQDPRQNPNSLQELWLAAEVAKKTLSERPRASIYVNHVGVRLKIDLTREEFEEATKPLLGRTRTTTEIVVRQAGLSWTAIDKVLLVGGSTRMPQVVTMLQELTGKVPEHSISPDEAVAHGAALYASLLAKAQTLAPGPPRFAVTNINSHSLGIVGVDPTTGRRRNQILIPKNTPLPHTVTRNFKTAKLNQPNVVIRVVEGESERPEACIQVGVCTIDNLPPNLPAGSPVQVSYTYLANGQLQVTGQLRGQQSSATTVFQRDNALADEELRLWAQYLR